ncbi:MAG: sugar phosphate isomerase/epimerase [Verrucomicrobia bacterium]|nr:sugar phosphate isomerase/epimerase [Verrucomicrobiota bacterium]
MKFGFLTSSYHDIEKAKRLGFTAIELRSAAFGDATKGDLDRTKIAEAKKLGEKHGIEITALAFYRCATKPEDVKTAPAEYTRVFDAAEALGVRVVTAMSGFDANLDWKGNLQFWADRFGPVAQIAEKRGLRVAFENWMAVHGRLPHKPQNMGGCPGVWKEWFALAPSKALGLEFDPSHLYWQGIDHVRALKEFKDRVYHVHAKDTEMLPEVRYQWGINADIFRFRIPGYGAINWAEFISALDEIGYKGGIAIEHEDPIYSGDRFDEGLVRGWQLLNPLIK